MRIIAGPCQHETLAQSYEIAKECKRVCDKHNIEYNFKSNFNFFFISVDIVNSIIYSHSNTYCCNSYSHYI